MEVNKVKEHLMEPIKGQNQPMETEERDWGTDDMDGCLGKQTRRGSNPANAADVHKSCSDLNLY